MKNIRNHIRFGMMAAALGASLSLFGQADKKTLFFISDVHLDTQWNWDVKTTIGEYIPNTLKQNFALLDKYPYFNLNFEGAVRYKWMKEFYPPTYKDLKNYILSGRWHVSGCSVDANDVMVSSAESIMRNWLYGHVFYKQEFGVRGGYDIMLPDCFGFSYALPSLARHCGMKGFHTSKLGWGSAQYDALAPWGIWQGVDGSQIYAIYKPHAYDSHEEYNHDMANDADMEKTLADNYEKYGLAAEIRYVGPRSDRGGGLQDNASSSGENTPYWLNYSAQATGPVRVVMSTPDDIFDYMDRYRNDKYQVYDGELPMRVHGVGAYTSQTILKTFNRRNELLADAAERTSAMAGWLGVAAYPAEKMRDAWMRNLWQAHHDGITGTSIPRAYTYSQNEYLLANKTFGKVFENAVGATARLLDTQVEGTPVVVYNPLSQNRTDVVEACLYTAAEPQGVRVYNKVGEEVLAQLLSYDAATGKATFIFAATVPSLGYAVYDARLGEPCTLKSDLTLDAESRMMSNGRYSATLTDSGEPWLYDLVHNRRLTSATSWQMMDDESTSWPAWEVTWDAVSGPVVATVDENVDIRVCEDGPLRKSFRVSRTKRGSTFVHYLRMTAVSDRLDCVSEVDWQTAGTLLKLNLPLFRATATRATYDLSLGTIQRGVRSSEHFEMQGHQWADLTADNGSFGVSILNDCKYGWDMPQASNLRLTLIHTPKTGSGYSYQSQQDLGVNRFTYALYPHEGSWSQDTQMEAARLNQPLVAFSAPKHPGELGKEIAFAMLNTDKVAVKALKKAEFSDELIVRVYEWAGEDRQDVTLAFPADIVSAREVNGLEEAVGEAVFSGKELTFSIGRYQPKTFAVVLASPSLSSVPEVVRNTAVQLPYDTDVMSGNSRRGDAGIAQAYPAEQVEDQIEAGGVTFTMGSREDGQNNALKCQGQTLTLHRAAGQDKLYLLLMSTHPNGCPAQVRAGQATVTFDVPYYSGYMGEVGNAFNNGSSYRKDEVAFTATHSHKVSTAEDEAYNYLYMYKYVVPLAEGVEQVTLPFADNLYLLAATVSDNANDDTTPLTEINTYMDYAELGDADDDCGEYLEPTSVTQSSYTNSREAGKYAADRDATTKWCSTSSAPWLQYTFDRPVEVCKWMVLNAGTEGMDWVSRSLKLQYLNNGTWVDADVVTDNVNNRVSRGVTPFKASSVRLQVVQGEQNGTTSRIYEFALYGKRDGGTDGIESMEMGGHGGLRLLGNYPNPFRDCTRIQFEAPAGANAVTVEVYDHSGRLVDSRPVQATGKGSVHTLLWQTDLPQGLYLYRLRTHIDGHDVYTQSEKLMIN